MLETHKPLGNSSLYNMLYFLPRVIVLLVARVYKLGDGTVQHAHE